MHQPYQVQIYRKSSQCCDAQFPGSTSCLQASINSHARFPFPGIMGDVIGPLVSRPYSPTGQQVRWFPDLTNRKNCVRGRGYEKWMTTEGFAPYYLFTNATLCCEKWYPESGSSCPSYEKPVSAEAEDEAWFADPYPLDNYYFPDFTTNNCGFGRDYPAWMGYNSYEKHYLFRKGNECCSKFFPDATNCPAENTAQTGYYWEKYQPKNTQHHISTTPIVYNHTFYPSLDAGTCVNGTDYPDWMASDVDFIRLYLFKKPEGCCNQWFKSDTAACQSSIIQGKYAVLPCPTNRPGCVPISTVTNATAELLSMWYPSFFEHKCKNDQWIPEYMLIQGYQDSYLFNSEEQCCAAFGYC